jgi:hypothetical protein
MKGSQVQAAVNDCGNAISSSASEESESGEVCNSVDSVPDSTDSTWNKVDCVPTDETLVNKWE